MASNIPGASGAVPGVYLEAQTIQRGISVPIGSRFGVIIGEGLREEVLVSNANGGGRDGFNSTFTSTKGANGRYFLLGKGTDVVAPVIQNRSVLYRDGIPVTLIEQTIDPNTSFDKRFGARLDPATGQIELQKASFVDQGGSYFATGATNVGTGVISNLTLANTDAIAETWSIRCTSVRRDGYGNPIDGYAKFVVRGSVSGVILDGYGNQITWQSNGVITSNGTLSFSISEGGIAFHEGDYFTIQIAGGGLTIGETLSAEYISEIGLNAPAFYTSMNDIAGKFGSPSLTNRLSLAAQLAFDNGPPGVFAIQAKPAVPRRLSYSLVTSASGYATADDLTFALPLLVTPDTNSDIHFFVTNPTTKLETQIIPNKVTFYDPTITSNPSGFIFGQTYSYTVVLEPSVQKSGTDGVLTPTGAYLGGYSAQLASSSVTFNMDDLELTRSVKIYDSVNGNNGTFSVISVSNGKINIYSATPFGTAETGVRFQVLDSSVSSSRILFTSDLALTLGASLRCTLVDSKDADFYDAGWELAYTAAERIDVDMVIPVPSQTISAIFQNGKVHVETMSNIENKRERILMIGAINGLLPTAVTGDVLAAVEDVGILEGIQGDSVTEILAGNIEDLANYDVQNAYGDSYRVVYFYPDQIVVNIAGQNTIVDGFFMAAAAMGYFSGSLQTAEPLTNKTIAGFSISNTRTFSPTVTKSLVNAGITLVTQAAGGGRVIWGKTTTTSGQPEEEEISIVFCRDAISKALRTGFQPYIGHAETPTLPVTLQNTAASLCTAFITQRLISAYNGLTVGRDPVEPRQWNISLNVQPIYPVNWIYIKVNVGLI